MPSATTTIRPDTLDRRRALYEDARDLLVREYGSDLRLEDVAKRVACSRRQLQRAFAVAGTSFATELRSLRVQRAAELLRSTDEPVSEVAARVGYRQPSQFAKAFRRRTNKSPSEFRLATRGAAGLDRAA